MSGHTCHALRCKVEIPPTLLMCGRHWDMVPNMLRDMIMQHYRPGQERDKQPSEDYILIASTAVEAVANLEGLR